MALRRRIAERISKTKERAGLEIPIIEELPLPAERPRVFELPKGIIPAIVRGEAYGETAGRWYRVTFPHPIVNPHVVCVAEARRGELPRVLKVPEIAPLTKLAELPEIKVLDKILEEGIPPLRLPRVRETIGEFVLEKPWGCPPICPPGTAMLEKLCKALNAMVGIVEAGLERINDILDKVDARMEKIRTTINTKLEDIDERLDTLRSETNDRLRKVQAGIDERFETLRTNTNNAFAGLFPSLYEAWGQRRDMALTVANIRNITSTGFEFLSMGSTTIHYIAIGRRR